MESPTPTRRLRRALVLAAALLVTFVLVALGIRAALPAAIARAFDWAAARYLDAPARVGAVELALWRGEITLSDVVVGVPGSGAEAAALEPSSAWLYGERVFAHLAWRDLLERRLRFQALVLDAPGVRLVRTADGAIVPWPARKEAPEAQGTSAAPEATGGPMPDAAATAEDEPFEDRPAGEAPPEDEAAPRHPAEEAEAGRESTAERWELILEKLVLRRPDLALADATAPDLELLRVAAGELGLDGLRLRGEHIALAGIDVTGPVVRVHPEMLARLPRAERAGSRGEDPDAPTAPAPDAPGATGPPADAGEEVRPGSRIEPGGALATTRIERVHVEAAKVTWLGPGGPLDLRVALEAQEVRAEPGSAFPVALSLGVGEGAIEADGRVNLDPFAFAGRVRWQALSVPFVLAAVAPELLPWLRASDTAGELEVRVGAEDGREDGAAALHVAGHASLRELSFADPDERELVLELEALDMEVRALRVPLGVERAAVDDPLSAEGEPPADQRSIEIDFGHVHAVRPSLSHARPTPALDALLAGWQAPPEAEPAAPPISISLAQLEFSRGRLELRDADLEPPFAVILTSVSLEARELHWPEPRVEEVRLRAVAPGDAPLRVDVTMHGEEAQGILDLERLALTPFEAHAARATGYRPRAGSGSLRIEAQRTGPRVELANDLTLHQLEVSAVDPGLFERRFGVSLGFALALLRDRRGNVRLRAPTAFDAGRGRVDPAAVATSALRQALVSAMNAPFRLLGVVLPADRPARPGEIELVLASAPGREEVRGEPPPFPALVALLADRPGLALVLRGRAGPDDRDALAEALGMDAADLPAERLVALAERRAEWARDDALEAGMDAARLKLAAPEVPAPPGVLIELVARDG
jgi:hypothetical protein